MARLSRLDLSLFIAVIVWGMMSGMGWKRALRLAVRRRFGIEISRARPDSDYERKVRLMNHQGVRTVLDIGANDGRYGLALREAGYTGRILSFEALAEPYAALARVSRADPQWEAFHVALGPAEGRATMNIAGNSAQSSSILPMLEAVTDAAPEAGYVGAEEVLVRRLDDVLADTVLTGPTYAKLDVQGYELAVLDGAPETVAALHGIELELSLVPLYDGGPLYREVMDRVLASGFELALFCPGFSDGASGRMLQADGVFYRA